MSGTDATVAASDGATRNPRRVAVGTVVSDKRKKTIAVEVKKQTRHPRYGKYVYRSLICHAHDEGNEARLGDRVEIKETRPLSKQKRWRLTRIVERAAAEESLPVAGTTESK